MRIPFTAEMMELDEKIKPYRIVAGMEVTLAPNTPDEIKEMNDKFLKLVREKYQENTRLI